MTPDQLVACLALVPHLTEIALRHDLKYAYGEPGKTEAKSRADEEFKHELIQDNALPLVAKAMFRAVHEFADDWIKWKFRGWTAVELALHSQFMERVKELAD